MNAAIQVLRKNTLTLIGDVLLIGDTTGDTIGGLDLHLTAVLRD